LFDAASGKGLRLQEQNEPIATGNAEKSIISGNPWERSSGPKDYLRDY
jgi:hypothetical protein